MLRGLKICIQGAAGLQTSVREIALRMEYAQR